MGAEVRRIAYLGPEASFTHQVTRCIATPRDILSKEGSISAVFDAVRDRRATHGIVPFENSSQGPVDLTLDCLVTSREDTVIVGDIYHKVQHCLLGKQADFSTITHVFSHPQALGQCRSFLKRKLPQASWHESASTADAAAFVALHEHPQYAAIGSGIAAEQYGLQCLASNIQDQDDNETMFLILSTSPPSSYPVEHSARSRTLLRIPQGFCWPTMVTKLHERGVKIISISTRPSRIKAWQYVFFVLGEFVCTLAAVPRQSKLISEEHLVDVLGVWTNSKAL